MAQAVPRQTEESWRPHPEPSAEWSMCLHLHAGGPIRPFGGWRVTDGGWRVTDGGWRVFIKEATLVFGPGMLKI